MGREGRGVKGGTEEGSSLRLRWALAGLRGYWAARLLGCAATGLRGYWAARLLGPGCLRAAELLGSVLRSDPRAASHSA